eukprot:15473514-Alexandrium_andersonii.AAC.1
MSASLVGSEMCIRDRIRTELLVRLLEGAARLGRAARVARGAGSSQPEGTAMRWACQPPPQSCSHSPFSALVSLRPWQGRPTAAFVWVGRWLRQRGSEGGRGTTWGHSGPSFGGHSGPSFAH